MGASTFLIEYTALQRVTGDSSAGSLVAFKQGLNDALHILCESNDWPWLEYRGVVDLIPTYTTGTITLVDSTTDYVTTTGTWSTAWSPLRLRTAAGNDYLLTYNAGNSRWELDRDIVAAEAAVTYTLYKDTYALVVRLRSLYLGWQTPTTEYPLQMVDQNTMQAWRCFPLQTGSVVTKIGMVEPDATNLVSQMMVFPVPTVAQSVHYRGYREVADLSSDSDTFPFPVHVLSTYRRLARSLVFEYRGALERAADERAKYEKELGRLVNRADNTANAQMAIRLDEGYFRRTPPTDDWYLNDGSYF